MQYSASEASRAIWAEGTLAGAFSWKAGRISYSTGLKTEVSKDGVR